MKYTVVSSGKTEKITGTHRRIKVRMGVIPTKVIEDATVYKRKSKHPADYGLVVE